MQNKTVPSASLRHIILRPDRIIDISYQGLFVLWISLILGFGLVYFLLSTFFPLYGLSHIANEAPLVRLFNCLYFSVVTATSVGYGDIVPMGIAKLVAAIQSIFTVFLSAIFVTKLITYKQELALYQVHKLSFEDIFSNTREGFFIIRQDFDHLIQEVKTTGTLSPDSQETMGTAFKQGQSLLEEILEFYDDDANMYTIDIRREQLLLEAVVRTLKRIENMLQASIRRRF